MKLKQNGEGFDLLACNFFEILGSYRFLCIKILGPKEAV